MSTFNIYVVEEKKDLLTTEDLRFIKEIQITGHFLTTSDESTVLKK